MVAAYNGGAPLNNCLSCLIRLNYINYEVIVVDDGSSDQTPEIISFFVEHQTADGPYGAKGVGELASIPTTPAVINAIFNATGIRCYSLPADKKWLRQQLLQQTK